MTMRQITAVAAALALGLSTAVGCGEDDEPAQQPKGDSPTTVETGGTTLGSTGTQPAVTEGGE